MSTSMVTLDEKRARLERRADILRNRLFRAIDALDTRRHQVQELGETAKKLALPALATALGVGAIALGVTLAVARSVKKRRARTLEARVAKLVARLTPAEKRPPILEEALRKLTMTFVGIVGTELARRVVKNAIDGRMPTGKLLIGKIENANGHTALVTR